MACVWEIINGLAVRRAAHSVAGLSVEEVLECLRGNNIQFERGVLEVQVNFNHEPWLIIGPDKERIVNAEEQEV
jgi:hypothetical protein